MAYITPQELRQKHPDLSDSVIFSNDSLEGLVADFTRRLERWRGVAYEPREAEYEFQHSGRAPNVILPHRMVAEGVLIENVTTLEPVTIQATQKRDGIVFASFGPGYYRAIYTHGFEETPPEVVRACGLYVWRESMADRNPTSGNAFQRTNLELGLVERVSTADWSPQSTHPSGWMDVDRIIVGLEDFRWGDVI